jgi:hypothetical protein
MYLFTVAIALAAANGAGCERAERHETGCDAHERKYAVTTIQKTATHFCLFVWLRPLASGKLHRFFVATRQLTLNGPHKVTMAKSVKHRWQVNICNATARNSIAAHTLLASARCLH